MATITAAAAQSNIPAKFRINGVITQMQTFTLPGGVPAAGGFSTGDVVQMVKIPKGAVVLDMNLFVDKLSGGNYTIGIGDSVLATRYATSLSTGSTSALFTMASAGMSPNGLDYSYSADDTVNITIQTATTSTLSGVFRLSVSYTLDNPNVP